MPFTLPSTRDLARHALPAILEGTVVPIALFYLGYAGFGLWGGLVAALAWSYGGVVRRLVRGEPVPGLVVLSAVALTARTALAVTTGSVFVYFLQPTLGTFLTGGVFLASAIAGAPLTERLARDIVQLPAAVTEHPAVRDLHVTLSVLWATVFVVNGATALWLLLNESVGTFLLVKSLANGGFVAGAIVVSIALFKRCVTLHEVQAEAV